MKITQVVSSTGWITVEDKIVISGRGAIANFFKATVPLGKKVYLERWDIVMGELSGVIDFPHKVESKLAEVDFTLTIREVAFRGEEATACLCALFNWDLAAVEAALAARVAEVAAGAAFAAEMAARRGTGC